VEKAGKEGHLFHHMLFAGGPMPFSVLLEQKKNRHMSLLHIYYEKHCSSRWLSEPRSVLWRMQNSGSSEQEIREGGRKVAAFRTGCG